ncbi:hypothetical protein AMJ44_13980 [candidate division WOR-1 bacterium DG_54_3]|uniref:Uncharacterized protein n=1 Tax=candidate division WOR-1 bacterium DG_54_3 TaxID=1703775 RepID=A0A0S7XMY1_UNCSA|nr:MAG: hypothetical protein AMJ44_13980 [candidate division WOR-1 bacterium DG_54_3]
MDKNAMKQAIEEIKTDSYEKEKDGWKEIISKILKEIKSLESEKRHLGCQINDIDAKLVFLKRDLDDIKIGRIDRISFAYNNAFMNQVHTTSRI